MPRETHAVFCVCRDALRGEVCENLCCFVMTHFCLRLHVLLDRLARTGDHFLVEQPKPNKLALELCRCRCTRVFWTCPGSVPDTSHRNRGISRRNREISGDLPYENRGLVACGLLDPYFHRVISGTTLQTPIFIGRNSLHVRKPLFL